MVNSYELTNITRVDASGVILRRIRALVPRAATAESPGVATGDLGGWLQSEYITDSSSRHAGEPRLGDSAWVYGQARVIGNAIAQDACRISQHALVDGEACVAGGAEVSGSAAIHEHSRIGDSARVGGAAVVTEHAQISGAASIRGRTHIDGTSHVRGSARIQGNARITGNAIVQDRALIDEFSIVGGSAVIGGQAQIGGDGRQKRSRHEPHVFDAQISGWAVVSQHARVLSDVVISGRAVIDGDALIRSPSDVLLVNSLGPFNEALTVFRTVSGAARMHDNPRASDGGPAKALLDHAELAVHRSGVSAAIGASMLREYRIIADLIDERTVLWLERDVSG